MPAQQTHFERVTRILATIADPPNRRERPVQGDLPDRGYSFWFDGGAAAMHTGGGTTYTFADRATAWQPYPWEAGFPNVHIVLPDGERVKLTFSPG